MADPKDTTSFFRKVVRFVANPTTEWAEVGTPTEEARETEYAKGELKAMIERKRRNDFVRKREFDMLRKVRREGLTSEQLAALGGSSRLDDSEAKNPEAGARQDSGVKAKIDEIEQQMVGETMPAAMRRIPPSPPPPPAPVAAPKSPELARGTDFYNAPTQPVSLDAALDRPNLGRGAAPVRPAAPVAPASPPAPPRVEAQPALMSLDLSPLPLGASADFAAPFATDLSEVAHDPDLDEAVIAFANADFEQCEQALVELTGPGGARAQHAETWLVLFDLYRATGQQQHFESRALDYARQFGWSAPQWFSMPKLVADAASVDRPRSAPIEGQVGWVCPAHLDPEAVARLASQAMQMPLPWVFDWSALRTIDTEACAKLSEVFRHWIPQDIDMRWLGGEHLLSLLLELAPNGVRDVDPAYWQLRLDALRMANRPDQFDEAAIDYCVTYEVSPPSWEAARCEVRVSGAGPRSTAPPMSVVSDVSTNYFETGLSDDMGAVQVGNVELSGQLVGDISEILRKMDTQLGSAAMINVSCAKLIRVDFIAAGDLLNWVLARRGENRSVSFIEAHRMVALFFGAMGINEHAKVKVRTV
jgi:hypothetical protein